MPTEYKRVVRIVRTGNAHTIVLPAPLLAALGWKRGDFVLVGTREGLSAYAYKVRVEEITRLKGADAA